MHRQMEISQPGKECPGISWIFDDPCCFVVPDLLQRILEFVSATLIVATLLNEIVGVVSIEHQWHCPGQETVCVWVGLFTGYGHTYCCLFSPMK